jgi:medium-chain acyl-[acyl-carrier-protein] hydrolase
MMTLKEKETKSCSFIAKFHECMPSGKIHLHAMVRYLQEMATNHADDLGCGYYDLQKTDCYWVLSNIKIRILDLPRYNSEFLITTWPSGLTKLLAEREFVVSDPYGKDLLLASSQWLIMNRVNNRPVNIIGLNLNLPQTHKKVFTTNLSRLKAGSAGGTPSGIKVPYSSLDVNGHVNNTEYIRWAVDAVCHSNGRFPDVRELQFTYLSEVYLEDELDILMSAREDGDGGFDILGNNSSQDKPAFLAQIML